LIDVIHQNPAYPLLCEIIWRGNWRLVHWGNPMGWDSGHRIGSMYHR